MKLLFDQNISHKILEQLPEKFSGSTSAKKENLINVSDKKIWDFAKKQKYIIVTQDSDFNDFSLLFGFPPKIIWIRTGNLHTKEILELLIEYASEIDKFNTDDIHGCFEIIRNWK